MVIDIHAHLVGKYIENVKRKVLNGIDRYGIDRVYLSGLQDYYSDEAQISYLNNEVAKFIQEAPDRIGGAVYVNPEHKNVLDVIKRATEEQGFEMIKLWLCTFADDPSVDAVMEYAEENGLPVLFHSFKKSTKQAPRESTGIHVANIAKRHPKTKIIMAHFGGSCYDGVPCIRDQSNVWCDQSGSICHGEELKYAVEMIGADRILFGTDNNFLGNLAQVQGAGLTEEQKEQILFRNAQKLLDRNFRL